jgi:tetratricopeptide (TPR) repeat protein
MAQQQLGEAEELLRAACERTQHAPEELLHHSLSLTKLGRLEEALVVLDRLLLSRPYAAGAWNNRAKILAALGKRDEALENFQKALASDPDLTPALEGKAMCC